MTDRPDVDTLTETIRARGVISEWGLVGQKVPDCLLITPDEFSDLAARARVADDTSVFRWQNEVRRCQHERDAAEADRDLLAGALNAITKRVTELEGDLESALAECGRFDDEAERKGLLAAEWKVQHDEMKADRDRLQRQVSELVRSARSEQIRANNSEARVTELEAALREARDLRKGAYLATPVRDDTRDAHFSLEKLKLVINTALAGDGGGA